MSEIVNKQMKENYSKKIWLLGAPLDNNNMGVNALGFSSIKCILNRWNDAEIIIRTYHKESEKKYKIGEQEVLIKEKALFVGVNLFKSNNIYTLLIYSLLLKIFPLKWLQEAIKANNIYYRDIQEADLVVDITGGDSFSDIYGFKRLRLDALLKLLIILCRNNFVLLPQTYGPFKTAVSQAIARYILANTSLIYGRDKRGVEYVQELLGQMSQSKPIEFIPDVAFVLEPEKTDTPTIEELKGQKDNGKIIVGFNVSGLLYDKDKKSAQKFGLKSDYSNLINNIIESFLKKEEVVVVLVPHVYKTDTEACRVLYQKFIKKYPDKIFLEEKELNCQQVKYLIGCCDFFLGSRMHSCIAAISQCLPALGLAYSGKFIGVFESAGVGDCVIDLRTEDEQKILHCVDEAFVNRNETAETLQVTIPKIKEKVLGLFEDVDKRLVSNQYNNN